MFYKIQKTGLCFPDAPTTDGVEMPIPKYALDHSTEALELIADHLGIANYTEFAEFVGASPALVSRWFAPIGSTHRTHVTVNWARYLSDLTGKRVTVAQILPELAEVFRETADPRDIIACPTFGPKDTAKIRAGRRARRRTELVPLLALPIAPDEDIGPVDPESFA